eukprot:EW706128.1.p3 GENE.EW706128.1~~EW706128.1.p3  ORF type:complete len:69 (-),score=9.49 EW706128.1:396-602(-)
MQSEWMMRECAVVRSRAVVVVMGCSDRGGIRRHGDTTPEASEMVTRLRVPCDAVGGVKNAKQTTEIKC